MVFILICSQYGEAQVTEVCKKLNAKGITPILFERYRRDHFISFHYQQNTIAAELKIEQKSYPLNSSVFPSIWYRTKPLISGEIPGAKSNICEKFCFYEWQNVLHSLEHFLSKSQWVNNVTQSRLASQKVYQLKMAKELGLIIPETIITNHHEAALKLFHHNKVIYKTLSSFFTKTESVYTTEITEESVLKNDESIAMAPGIYQQMIQKCFELRVTVVGEKLFVVKINSQKIPETTVDWRRMPIKELYEEGELSALTSQKLLQFHQKMGLVYAAYDFVVDQSGAEIFLECNPSGQWLWLENHLGLHISEEMANVLSEKKVLS